GVLPGAPPQGSAAQAASAKAAPAQTPLAQTAVAQTPIGQTPSAPGAAAQSAPDDYLVGPQDVLSLTVFNDETLSRPALVVDTDGTIDCPFVGRQKVMGMTTRQIEELLRRLLGLRRDAQGKVVGGYL